MHNADVLVREDFTYYCFQRLRPRTTYETQIIHGIRALQDVTVDEFIDVIDGNRKYCKCASSQFMVCPHFMSLLQLFVLFFFPPGAYLPSLPACVSATVQAFMCTTSALDWNWIPCSTRRSKWKSHVLCSSQVAQDWFAKARRNWRNSEKAAVSGGFGSLAGTCVMCTLAVNAKQELWLRVNSSSKVPGGSKQVELCSSNYWMVHHFMPVS